MPRHRQRATGEPSHPTRPPTGRADILLIRHGYVAATARDTTSAFSRHPRRRRPRRRRAGVARRVHPTEPLLCELERVRRNNSLAAVRPTCRRCYDQLGPVFDPRRSSSYGGFQQRPRPRAGRPGYLSTQVVRAPPSASATTSSSLSTMGAARSSSDVPSARRS